VFDWDGFGEFCSLFIQIESKVQESTSMGGGSLGSLVRNLIDSYCRCYETQEEGNAFPRQPMEHFLCLLVNGACRGGVAVYYYCCAVVMFPWCC
jgi:hypothetical protein